MNQKTKLAFLLVGSLLIFSVMFHIVLMCGKVTFESKYVLAIHSYLLLILWPSASLAKDSEQDVVIENTFQTALKVFPLWLTFLLGGILLYSAAVFINYTYFDSPIAAKPDMPLMLDKFAKGSSAATMFFYAGVFGLMILNWKVKSSEDEGKE